MSVYTPPFYVPSNAFLDYIFYDMSALTEAERNYLYGINAIEGSFLVVSPAKRKDRDAVCLRPYASDMPLPKVLTAAGVGSSDVGAASFARDVANALGQDVLAVVAGYGTEDLSWEAWGGFYLFGYANAVRRFRRLFNLADRETDTGYIDKGADVVALAALLTREDVTFDYIVGHSKGNLLLSAALYIAATLAGSSGRETLPPRFKNTICVTMGAITEMPLGFKDVVDVLGLLDRLGRINSRSTIPADKTGLYGHHTNPLLPYHMDVEKIIREIADEAAAKAAPFAIVPAIDDSGEPKAA
jgi:hypothetical protein